MSEVNAFDLKLLRNFYRQFSGAVIVRVIKMSSLLGSVSCIDTLDERRNGGQNAKNVGRHGVLSIWQDEEVRLAGEVISPDVAPIHHHEFVAARHNYEFRNLCQSIIEC